MHTSMSTCVYTCAHVHVRVYTCPCARVCTCTCVRVHMCERACLHVCAHMCPYARVCMYAHVRVHVCMCVRVCEHVSMRTCVCAHRGKKGTLDFPGARATGGYELPTVGAFLIEQYKLFTSEPSLEGLRAGMRGAIQWTLVPEASKDTSTAAHCSLHLLPENTSDHRCQD